MPNQASRVLITGAAGFIGSHLARRLASENIEVGIIKRDNSDTWRINDLLGKLATYDVDIRDTRNVARAVADFKPQAICHLATYYTMEHQPQEIPLLADTNYLGTLNLLEAAKESSVRLFVNTSTCFVYKESNDKLAENATLSPLNLYALTKIHAEQACTYYAERHGLRAISFRIFPPYGPSDHERRLIPYSIKSLLEGEIPKMTTGNQRWDFIYVDDIVDAYFKVLSAPELPHRHEIFNIGTGHAVSIREVAARIREITGATAEPDWGAVPHRNNEVWHTCADISKVVKTLGWRPKTPIIGEGLERTVEWYKDHRNKGKVG